MWRESALSIHQVSLEYAVVRGKGLAVVSKYWSHEVLDFYATLLALLLHCRAHNLSAHNLSAHNLSAHDLSAHNLSAHDLTAY